MALLSEKIRKMAQSIICDVYREDPKLMKLANEALTIETALADATKRAEEAEAKAREFADVVAMEASDSEGDCIHCGVWVLGREPREHKADCPVAKAREYLRQPPTAKEASRE